MEKHGVYSVIGACDGEDKCVVKTAPVLNCVCVLGAVVMEDERGRFK